MLALLLVIARSSPTSYGVRQNTLTAAAGQASADRIKRLTAEIKRQRPVAEAANRYLKENSELRQKLIDAENKLAALERVQTQKHLSADQQRFLIEALRPYRRPEDFDRLDPGRRRGLACSPRSSSRCSRRPAGTITAKPGISTQDWPRDPVGIEVVMNETDARAGNIPAGVAGLINVVRQLGLVYDNTVYMDNDVPAGQALLKVGKKLRK